jgi:K+-sensing histidine kinase KdpD
MLRFLEQPDRKRSGSVQAVAYLVAVVATTVGVVLRWLLDSVLGGSLPFLTLFGAVAVAIWRGGFGPALLATVLGYLAANYLFIEPRGALAFRGMGDLVGLAPTCPPASLSSASAAR